MKKMLLMAILLIGAISYGAAGLDLKFNTDGKLHEEKLLNRSIVSEDTELEIRKTGNGEYEIVRSSEEPDSEASVEKATVKKKKWRKTYEKTIFYINSTINGSCRMFKIWKR